MSLLLKPHLGLGDAFILNGLARWLLFKHSEVVFPCQPYYATSIRWMFRDEPRIKVVPAPVDEVARMTAAEVLNLGHWHTGRYDSDCMWARPSRFDQAFYAQAGAPFDVKWTHFKVVRDEAIERPVPEQRFIFAHGMNVPGAITPDGPVTSNVFGWWGMLEAAAELHCADSSFLNFAEMIETRGELFTNAYVPHKRWRNPTLRKPWKIVSVSDPDPKWSY